MDFKEKLHVLPDVLDLKRKMVGVRIFKDQEAYEKSESRELRHKITYCYMVKLGSYGKHFKANASHFLCEGALKALGMINLDPKVLSGEIYESLGLYRSREIAKDAQQEMLYREQKIYGVEIFPLDENPENPYDIAIIVDNSYVIMRVVQGYSYNEGIHKGIRIGGNQGICSEVTAFPFAKNDINVSLLCSGTRFFAKWDPEDVAIGIPQHKMSRVVDGIIKTINPTESDSRKKIILKKLRNQNVNFNITMDSNYYK